MEIKEQITLDMLTKDSVSIKTQKVLVMDDDTESPIGDPHRRAYVNSNHGREELETNVDEPYKSAILAVWGDVPTVKETEEL